MTDIDYDKLVNIVRTIFLDQLCELGGFIVVNSEGSPQVIFIGDEDLDNTKYLAKSQVGSDFMPDFEATKGLLSMISRFLPRTKLNAKKYLVRASSGIRLELDKRVLLEFIPTLYCSGKEIVGISAIEDKNKDMTMDEIIELQKLEKIVEEEFCDQLTELEGFIIVSRPFIIVSRPFISNDDSMVISLDAPVQILDSANDGTWIKKVLEYNELGVSTCVDLKETRKLLRELSERLNYIGPARCYKIPSLGEKTIGKGDLLAKCADLWERGKRSFDEIKDAKHGQE